jgi:iron(III) transport system substrate-binding protein
VAGGRGAYHGQILEGITMQDRKYSRRDVFKASTALALGAVFAEPVKAAAPPPSAVTPAVIEAARREGKVAFYTGIELQVAEKFAKAFEAKYPGIAVRVERSGSERVFQRIGQEQESRIHAVDVACSTDAAHLLFWKRNSWLAPYVPEDVAKYFAPEHVDQDGMYATLCAWFSVIGYNTNLVKPEDAPKSFVDLLDPKWKGMIVKSHPAYSGTTLTATFDIAREIGWSYLEKLAQQKIMQVQSALDPSKKLMLGERAVTPDGVDYVLVLGKEQGRPVDLVHASEGTPLIVVPSGVFRSAPNPNAARLFQSFLFSPDAQQMFVDVFAQHSFHALVKEKPGRKPLSEIKLMRSDPAAVEAQSEEIKARYTRIFGV